MASETEEFEFRARAEREAAQGKVAPAAPAVSGPKFSAADQVKKVRENGFGSGFERMLQHAAYTAGANVTDLAAGSRDITGAPMRPEGAAALGAATNAAIQAIPMLGGAKAGEMLEPLSKRFARWSMQSALKPSKAELVSGKGQKAVDTLLKTGTNVTEGGAEKLRGRIDDINKEITSIITGSTKEVDKATVAKALRDVESRAFLQANPEGDLAAVQKALDEFMNHPLLMNKIPVELAQKVKIGTYRSIGEKAFGELKGATTESQKALARGLKEEIAKLHPEVAKLNAEESELLNAEEMVRTRALMDQNKNIGGLSWLATHPGEWAAMILDRSPLAKSLLARAANTMGKDAGKAIGAAGGAAVDVATQQNKPRTPEQERRLQELRRKQQDAATQ